MCFTLLNFIHKFDFNSEYNIERTRTFNENIKSYDCLLDYWIILTEIGQEEGLVTDKVKQDCYGGIWRFLVYTFVFNCLLNG